MKVRAESGDQVWKFPLEHVTGDQAVLMPAGARVLDLQLQHERPTLWALVDPTTPSTEARYFRVVATGSRLPADALYVGSVHQEPWVWHVWETTEGWRA